MQAALNPALAAALTLERAAQVGEFNPVTSDGNPTVVGGLMQMAMPPTVPDVVQQAGLGSQIKAMQMQEAQNAVMNAAMQRARGPAGIESLNPQMGNFAQGGIVGYNGEENSLVVDPPERSGETVVEPVAPLAPAVLVRPEEGLEGLATSSAPAIADMRQILAETARLPVNVNPRNAIQAGIVRRQVANDFARATGNDPEMVANQIKQMEDFYRRRDEQLANRFKQIEGRRDRESLAQAMMNFQQMKGRPIGEGFVSASRGLTEFQGRLDNQMREIENLRLQAEGLKMERINTLRTQKYNTDMGFFGEAMKDEQRLIDNNRNLKKTEYDLAKRIAELHSQEARTSVVEEGRSERAEEREETIRRGQDIRKQLGLSRPGAGGREPILRKVEEDSEGNAIGVMSDGSRRSLGYKRAEFERRVGEMQQKLLKDGPPGIDSQGFRVEYRRLPFNDQRKIATEYIVGKPPAPNPAPNPAPSPAPLGTRDNPIRIP